MTRPRTAGTSPACRPPSSCIAHGINMRTATDNHKAAVGCGHWPLFRYDPRREAAGENPLRLDSPAPRRSFEDFAALEARFKMLSKSHPERAKELAERARKDNERRWRLYTRLAGLCLGEEPVHAK
jgi:pyruvate-ferredoxin/flavodoxin oxidoreductase